MHNNTANGTVRGLCTFTISIVCIQNIRNIMRSRVKWLLSVLLLGMCRIYSLAPRCKLNKQSMLNECCSVRACVCVRVCVCVRGHAARDCIQQQYPLATTSAQGQLAIEAIASHSRTPLCTQQPLVCARSFNGKLQAAKCEKRSVSQSRGLW